jgi:hypothetical protein
MKAIKIAPLLMVVITSLTVLNACGKRDTDATSKKEVQEPPMSQLWQAGLVVLLAEFWFGQEIQSKRDSF